MAFLIVLAALAFLMFAAYRGHSVILFAPIAALGAVLLTVPSLVAPMFTGLFMAKMVGFLKLYFPVFMLGALFGKLIELSGFSKSIVAATIGLVGRSRAILSIVMVCALLTYGGVSLFVVVFAVYPFAAELFRHADIPKRLIPGTIALGAFTFTMDSLPGTPQIQNIIPTSFFGTTSWAAPWLGTLGGIFILIVGMAYLESRRRAAARNGRRLWRRTCSTNPRHLKHASWPIRCWQSPIGARRRRQQAIHHLIPRVYGELRPLSRQSSANRYRLCSKFRTSPESGRWKRRCWSVSYACWFSPGNR